MSATKPKIERQRSIEFEHQETIDGAVVTICMTQKDWNNFHDLVMNAMIPHHDLLYCAFFQGLENIGWKEHEYKRSSIKNRTVIEDLDDGIAF